MLFWAHSPLSGHTQSQVRSASKARDPASARPHLPRLSPPHDRSLLQLSPSSSSLPLPWEGPYPLFFGCSSWRNGTMQKLPQADGGAADLDKLDGLDARGECARGSAAGSAAKQATGGASSATETAVAPFSASGSGGGGGGPGASDAPGAEVRVRECVKAYRLPGYLHTLPLPPSYPSIRACCS